MLDRDDRGRFAPGNPGGPGNPLGGQVARLRAALIRAITPEQIAELARALLVQALDGDVAAAKLVLSYTIGRPVEHDLIERLEALETQIGGETHEFRSTTAGTHARAGGRR